jgi:branched-chain amino acid transport system substrate-binding protein
MVMTTMKSSSSQERLTRRAFLGSTVLAGATLVAGGVTGPNVRAAAKGPIKIGVPCTLSGSFATYGKQAQRGCELIGKEWNARGGLLGREVQFLYEDTKADPKTAVRKARKLVEKAGVKFLTGVTASSEAVAIEALLPNWQVIFVSTINGAGKLTAANFNRYFFRTNTSGPMGARAVSLYLGDSPMQRFYGIGADYVWGRNSVASFKGNITKLGKDFVGSVFTPIGTTDFATYISKIRDAKPEGVYVVLAGQDEIAFYKQAKEFGLSDEAKLLVEQVSYLAMKASGMAMEGVIGGSRYPFTVDTPRNKAFVKRFYEEYGQYPDMYDGESYEGTDWLLRAIEKAGTAEDVDAVIKAFEGMDYDGLEGKMHMRACDHQAVQPGYVVQASRMPGYDGLVPKVVAVYSGERVTPGCRKQTFES